MKTLKEKIETLKEETAIERLDEITTLATQEQAEKMLIAIGAINALYTIANNLSAKVIQGLQKIRDEQLYRAVGFNRFDEYLDNYTYSPMGYKTFNAQEKLLATEGETLFDLFNGLKIPVYKRRQLGAGAVQLDTESGQVFVTLPPTDDGEPEQVAIAITDRTQLLDTLALVADTANALRRKTAKLNKQVEQGQKDYDDLRRRADAGERLPASGKTPEAHVSALMSLLGAFQPLIAAAGKLVDADKPIVASAALPEIAAQIERLRAAYEPNGDADAKAEAAPTSAAAKLSDDELTELFD